MSACSVRTMSSTPRATSGDGARPSAARGYAACEAPASPGTAARPVRMRCQASTISGTRFMTRKDVLKFASGSLARASGSREAARDTPVRNASSGWQSRGSVRSRTATGAGRPRASFSRSRKSADSFAEGSSPVHSRVVTSSKGTAPARSRSRAAVESRPHAVMAQIATARNDVLVRFPSVPEASCVFAELILHIYDYICRCTRSDEGGRCA